MLRQTNKSSFTKGRYCFPFNCTPKENRRLRIQNIDIQRVDAVPAVVLACICEAHVYRCLIEKALQDNSVSTFSSVQLYLLSQLHQAWMIRAHFCFHDDSRRIGQAFHYRKNASYKGPGQLLELLI
jgi:hypothetical protein